VHNDPGSCVSGNNRESKLVRRYWHKSNKRVCTGLKTRFQEFFGGMKGNSAIYIQYPTKKPVFPPKSPLHELDELALCDVLGARLLRPQIKEPSLIEYTQKSPTFPQKSPIFLPKSTKEHSIFCTMRLRRRAPSTFSALWQKYRALLWKCRALLCVFYHIGLCYLWSQKASTQHIALCRYDILPYRALLWGGYD